MPLLIRPLPFIVYLLHIEPEVMRARHYLGICRHDRLKARMKEHRSGHGAALTAKALERGASLYLVHAMFVGRPEDERLLKQRGHYRRMCPLCSATVDEPNLFLQSCSSLTRPAAPAWQAKGW